MSAAVANRPNKTKRQATPHATAAASNVSANPTLSAQLAELAKRGRKVIDARPISEKWRSTVGTSALVSNVKDKVREIYTKDTMAPTVAHTYVHDGPVQDKSITFSEHLIRGEGSDFGGTIGTTGRPLGELTYLSKQGLPEEEGGWDKDGRNRGGTAPIETRKWHGIEQAVDEYSQRHGPMFPKTGKWGNPTLQIRRTNDQAAEWLTKYGYDPDTYDSGKFESTEHRDKWVKALDKFRNEGGLTESEFKEVYPVMSSYFSLQEASDAYQGPEFMEEHMNMTKRNHSMMVTQQRWNDLAQFAKLQSRPLTKEELERSAIEMSACSGKGPLRKELYGKLAIVPFKSLEQARKEKFFGLDWSGDDGGDDWDKGNAELTLGGTRIISHNKFLKEYPMLSEYATITDAENAFSEDGPAGTGSLAKWCSESYKFKNDNTVVLAPEGAYQERSAKISSANWTGMFDKLKGCLYTKGTCQHDWCQSHGKYKHNKPKGQKGTQWSVDHVEAIHAANETEYTDDGTVTKQGWMAHAPPPGTTSTNGVKLDMDRRMRGTKAERRARHAKAEAETAASASSAGTAMTATTAATATDADTAMTRTTGDLLTTTDKTALKASEMPETAPPSTAAPATAAPAKSYLEQVADVFNRLRGAAPTTATGTMLPLTAMDERGAYSMASTAAPVTAI